MHIVSLSCCTVCRKEKCHRWVSVGSFQVRGRWPHSPSPLFSHNPLKAFRKSRVFGFIRAVTTVPCKPRKVSPEHFSTWSKWEMTRSHLCYLLKNNTQLLHPSPSIYSLMMMLCHRQWCWLVLSFLWSHSKQNAASGFVRLEKKHMEHFFLHSSIICCVFGVPYAWCSCSQCSLWT